MTLGHQPYPARNNLEVLNYVRSGGRLNQPPHCPEGL
jgi:proto-oncogene tyrosine-protein kinase ROS